MKKLFIFILMFCLISTVAIADEKADAQAELCKAAENLAGTIMKGRQLGTPMIKMIEAIESRNTPEESKELARKLVIYAFERPQFSLREYQVREIDQFRNQVFLECYKANSK
jgi:hypothetical protein